MFTKNPKSCIGNRLNFMGETDINNRKKGKQMKISRRGEQISYLGKQIKILILKIVETDQIF